jgi:hypothetical protein
MVDTTRSLTVTMKASPDWPAATDVQTSVNAWNAIADQIEANATIVIDLANQRKAAVAKQRALKQKWRVCRKQLLSNADTFCADSLEKVHGFGLDAATLAALGLLSTPEGLATSPGKLSGEARFTWIHGVACHGFVVQHATDAASSATYSPIMPWTKSKYTLTGALPGTTVYFRVAAIDPHAASGQSPWSGWIAATVR